ncbi:MAG TPA: Crp/Fnr family transcriptional regulator [Pseudonocardia sp.]|nr:Crp/Fnr family transcriptional regulator [Pseudonocardia sp.]
MDVERLGRVPLLGTLPRPRLERLARELPVRHLAAGDVVAHSGAPARHLIVLEAGSLAAVHDTRHGSRVRLSTVTGPRVVDKAATLDGGVHTATWCAATPCRVRLLPAAVLRNLLDDEPALRAHVVRHLAAEVNGHRRARIRRAAPGPVAQVADWLVEAASRVGGTVPVAGGQQGLGDELGLSRVTVNRALQTLAAAGAVEVRPRRVRVLDAEQLAEWSGRRDAARRA